MVFIFGKLLESVSVVLSKKFNLDGTGFRTSLLDFVVASGLTHDIAPIVCRCSPQFQRCAIFILDDMGLDGFGCDVAG